MYSESSFRHQFHHQLFQKNSCYLGKEKRWQRDGCLAADEEPHDIWRHRKQPNSTRYVTARKYGDSGDNYGDTHLSHFPEGRALPFGKIREEDTKLFWSYVLACCLFVVSLITCSLPWSHWAYTINVCPGYNCECVLFGKSFVDQFSGGQAIYCQLVTFLQIPLFLTAAVLSFYQGRQALIIKRERRRLKRRQGEPERNPILVLKSRDGRMLREGDVVVEERVMAMEPPSRRANVTLLVIGCICLLVVTGIYVLLVVGYRWSCDEYRKMLVKLLKASGNMAQILSERLECTAIFDFMDYLQPKRRLFDPADYGRKTKINTGLSLYVGQLSLLANIVIWAFIVFIHGRLLRKRIQSDRKEGGLGQGVEVDYRRRR